MNMLCAFLRLVQHMEKLPGCLGGQLLPHFVHTKACLKTQPLRWGLLEQKKTVHPRTELGFTRKTFWTQGPDPQKAKEDGSKQVSVHGNQRGETGLSMSQKVKEAGRDFSYLIVVFFGVSITGGLLYTVFKELFSSSSPNIIYGKALGKCRAHPEVSSLMRRCWGAGMHHVCSNDIIRWAAWVACMLLGFTLILALRAHTVFLPAVPVIIVSSSWVLNASASGWMLQKLVVCGIFPFVSSTTEGKTEKKCSQENEMWQMDMFHFVEFGKLKSVHYTIDTCSSF